MSLNKFTQQMQAMLPQWMKMAKDPNSVGAQFLDVFGLEFQDVEDYLNNIIANQFIGTADVSQIDITYKVPVILPVVLDIESIDTVEAYRGEERFPFSLTGSLRVFYTRNDENYAIIDREKGLIYLRPMDFVLEGAPIERPFDYIVINGTVHQDYSLHHVWNAFDEFGLLLGIERLYGERNEQFKERILDVFRKPGNSTKQGLVNAISRELGLPTDAITVKELADKAFRGTLLNDDGTPSKKLISYAERINKILGFTWDNMTWGEAYWRSVEESNIGLEYLPHIWDAPVTEWRDEDFQSGIGDGDDLKVSPPKEESNVRKFKYYVGLRGRQDGTETIYPEISFKYKIVAKGQIPNEEYKPEVYRYTIVASEIVKLYYIIRAMKDYYKTTVIDFSGPGYTFDSPTSPGIEIITGNTILSNPTDRYLKVILDMKTRSPKDTPEIHDLTIKWRDTGGGLNDFTLASQDDFTRNDGTVNTQMTDVFISGFEFADSLSSDSNSDNIVDGWTPTANGSPTYSFIFDSVEKAQRISVTGSTSPGYVYLYKIVPVKEGDVYSYSADVKAANVIGTFVGRLTVTWRDSGGTAINTTYGTFTNTIYQRVKLENITPPVGAVTAALKIEAYIANAGDTGDVWFRNLYFHEGSVAKDFPGSDYTSDGKIQLGYGDFYYMIDTEGSWRDGTFDHTISITQQGSLKLNLPNL